MKIKTAALAVLAALVSTPVLAVDEYRIEQTVDASAVSPAGASVDIIGIKAGMHAADALSILNEQHGQEGIDRFHMRIGTRQVQSQEFDVYYTGGSVLKKGSIDVYLTSPAAGSTVFAASRSINFKVEDGLPSVSAITDQLTQKYGKPTASEKRDHRPAELYWYFGDKGTCTEKYGVCTTLYNGGPSGGAGGVLGSYMVEKTADYEAATKLGADVVVVASVRTAHGYPDGVSTLTVSFVDLNLRAKSARADYDLLMKKQAEFDKKTVALPKL